MGKFSMTGIIQENIKKEDKSMEIQHWFSFLDRIMPLTHFCLGLPIYLLLVLKYLFEYLFTVIEDLIKLSFNDHPIHQVTQ